MGSSCWDGTQPFGVPAAHFPDPHWLGDIRELRLPKGAAPALKRIALSPGREDLAGGIYPTVHSDQCICHVILSGFI